SLVADVLDAVDRLAARQGATRSAIVERWLRGPLDESGLIGWRRRRPATTTRRRRPSAGTTQPGRPSPRARRAACRSTIHRRGLGPARGDRRSAGRVRRAASRPLLLGAARQAAAGSWCSRSTPATNAPTT